jgi:hypothetical protein
MAITNTDFQNIALAISAYTDELYTNERKLNSTGIVGMRDDVTADGESFIGQMRWYQPLQANINVASLSNAADGTYTDITTEVSNYIKTVRTFGAKQVNLQEVVSKQDGLMKIARDFAEVRGQDEHNGLLKVLQGVAAYEVGLGDLAGSGNGGLISFDTDPNVAATGFFVDINALGEFGAAATGTSDARKLFDSTAMGAARGERLFKAIGMAFKDYEPDYMYLITSPENMAEFRSANLVDDIIVTDGNLEFSTLFGGKFRLIPTRANQMIGTFTTGDLNAQSTKATFVVKPESVAFAPIGVSTPVEVERNAAAYTGGGSTDVWYRYGFIMHPSGYDWAGATNVFATNANFAAEASWGRKVDALNLGILPIFHS